jgi:hypothetical protein
MLDNKQVLQVLAENVSRTNTTVTFLPHNMFSASSCKVSKVSYIRQAMD